MIAQAPETRSLRFLPLQAIRLNPENPRGPDVRKHDLRFDNLRDSIADFGILVPLVVRQVGPETYELIDGERRYHAATSLRIAEVPAIITTGAVDSDQIRRTMFQIHSNWSQWDAAMQCHALEGLYHGLRERFGEDWPRITADLVAETGTDERTARNRLQFLKWPDEIKQAVYRREHGNAYWYIVEIEDKIVEPALKNFPEYFEVVSADEVRTLLYQKYRDGLVRAAVQVRSAAVVVRKPTDIEQREVARGVLDRLVHDVGFSFEEARDEYVERFPATEQEPPLTPRALLNMARRLADALSGFSALSVFSATGRSRADPGELADGLLDAAGSAERLAADLQHPVDRAG